MTTNQTPNNNVLTLNPPRAPEATEPVVGADYGVPKHAYDLKPMGLTIKVDPPLAGTVQEGDVIRLRLNNASTEATKTIGPGEENDIHTLYLPKGLLLPNYRNTLVFTITRGSQNEGTSTPELTLLYNAIRPGMEDRTPGDGAHSELQLILPQEVIDDGIDAERAKQGVKVCFAYPYCRAYDVIRLNCNGQDVVRTVAGDEAPAIPTAEPTTICVTVGEEVFKQAGDSPKFIFSYTVTDQLGNGPDTDSPYSGTVEVDVHLKETRLVAPDLAEDPDDPSDDPSTIDLAKLGTKDLTVLVHAFAPTWQPNDKIRVTYTASKPDAPGVTHTVEADVVRIPFTYKLMVPNAKVIAGSLVRGKYQLIRSGEVIATSRTASADVIGEGIIELLPPFLVNANEPIEVLEHPNGITVRIEFLNALEGDRARLVEVNPPAGSPQFPLVAFNAKKRVNTLLSASFLAARHDKVMELRWNLNRDGGQAGKSDSVSLNVSKIIDGDTRLPSPRVSQAPDNIVLDLRTFEGAAEITVTPWIGISTENFVNMKISGIDNNNDNCVIPILTDHNITETEKASGLKESVSRENLLTLKHNTKFEILFEALPSATTNSTPIIFPTLNLNLLKDPLIVMEDFETGIVGAKPVGTVMDFPSMTVTVVAGTVNIGANGSYYAPPITLKYIYIAPRATLRFTLKNTARSIRFGIADSSKIPSTYTCYDENLQLIKSQLTPPYGGQYQVWVEITETPNRKIKYIDITDGGGDSFLDNFSMIY